MHYSFTHLRGVPVSADAPHAEAVATWSGRRVDEHIEADGALELLRRQVAAMPGHPVSNQTERHRQSQCQSSFEEAAGFWR